MKIFCAFSGPRKNHNTHTLLKKFLEGVLSNHNGIEIVETFLPDKKIGFCHGCLLCKGDLGKCFQKDDMTELYEQFKQSDVIVLASPIYWFHISAQLKVFIDRLFGLTHDDFKGKKVVFITTFEDVDIKSSGAYNAVNSLTDICDYLDMDFCVKLCVSTSELPVKENEIALLEAFHAGQNLKI